MEAMVCSVILLFTLSEILDKIFPIKSANCFKIVCPVFLYSILFIWFLKVASDIIPATNSCKFCILYPVVSNFGSLFKILVSASCLFMAPFLAVISWSIRVSTDFLYSWRSFSIGAEVLPTILLASKTTSSLLTEIVDSFVFI